MDILVGGIKRLPEGTFYFCEEMVTFSTGESLGSGEALWLEVSNRVESQ